MANPKIKFKRSAVEGKRPDNSSLELGEIAVNTYDGRIYLKRDTSGAGIDGIKLVNPWIENNANTGIACTYPVNISGLTTFTENVHLLDSDKLLFGAGEDLEIYHDGSHSYISDQGQGNLKVLSNNIRFTNPDESKVSATFVAAGDVDLYYDNNLRFSTTGVGVTIWGETETRTLNVSGVSTFGSNVIASGIITATQFIGDGSGLSNIVGTGTGVYIQVNDTQIGAASTLAFSGNLSATVSAGIATITVPTTSLVRQSFTATANQTSFTVSGGYTDGYIDIHLNGVKLNVGTDVTANDESTIVLSVGASAGDVIETTVFKTLQISPDTNIRKQVVNITDVTPSINVTSGYNVGHLDVYLNGLKLIDGTDFTATNGTSVSLTRAAVDGDTVEFVAVRTLNSIPGAGIGTDGSVNTVGIITAASFHGDGLNVTGISTSNITNYGVGFVTFTNNNQLTNGAGYITTSFTNTNQLTNGAGFITASDDITGNAATTTALETARTISGTSFDGTSNITLNNSNITNGAGYITTSFTNTNQLTNGAGYITTSFTNTNQLTNGAGFITASDDITGNAASATTLETARNIAGVSFDGSQNISLNNNAITNGAGYITTSFTNTNQLTNGAGYITTSFTNTNQLTNGAGFITNSVTGNFSVNGDVSIGGTLTYEDVTNIDSVGMITARRGIVSSGIVTATGFVGDLTGDVTGTTSNATQLDSQSASYYLDYDNFNNTPTIPTNTNQLTNGAGFITTSFTNTNQLTNGAGFITTSFTNTNQLTNGAGFITDSVTGDLTVTGNVSVGGTLTYTSVADMDAVGLITAQSGINVTGGQIKVGAGFSVGQAGIVTANGFVGPLTGDVTGNADTATSLAGNRTISGVSFNGTSNITLNNSGITNGAGYITTSFTNTNQLTNGAGFITSSDDITGNAATSTKLATARTIAGVSFDGSQNISLNNNAITNGAGYITTSFTNTNQLTNGAGYITTSFTNTNQLTNGAGFITGSDNTTGTSGGLSGAPSITVTDLTATGTVSIAGTLSYEDVTSVDSLGIGTFRSGVKVTTGGIEVSNGGADFTGDVTVNDNLYIGGTTNYLSSQPTGTYGSIQINGSGKGNWEGYSIDGRAVFMHDGVSTMGLYDDVNNHWVFRHIMGGSSITQIRSGNNGNTIVCDGSNNVGIGEDTPETKLEVNGDITVQGDVITKTVTYGNNQDLPYLIAGSTSYTGATTNWGTHGFQHRLKSNSTGTARITVDAASGEAFCIDNARRIGIGTDSPTEKLDVAGHIKLDSGPTLESGVSGNGDTLKITTSSGYTEVGPYNTSYSHFVTDRSKFYFNKPVVVDGYIASYDTDIVLNTDINEERIRIKNDTGNIGIGTNNPTTKLEVSGGDLYVNSLDGNEVDIKLGIHATHSNFSVIKSVRASNSQNFLSFNIHNGSLYEALRIHYDEGFSVFGNGDYSTTAYAGEVSRIRFADQAAPFADIVVESESASSRLGSLIFRTKGSSFMPQERLRIASAGQIGLGGENYGTSGQVLTSNGSSSAPTWQNLYTSASNITSGTLNTARLPNTYTKAANVQVQATGSNSDIRLDAAEHIILESGEEQSGSIYFRGNNGTSSYRFSKGGQTVAEGFLNFEDLTVDRTFTFPDATGTLPLLESSQTFSGDTTFDGRVNVRGHIDLSDNQYLYFGSGDDAELFFDGAQLYLDLNAGSFYIRDDSTIRYSFEDDGHFTAAGNITAYSDITLKKNIEVIPDSLDKVLQLRGVTFDRKDIETSRQTGVIAQEVEKVLPEVVSTGEDGIKSVAYGNMVGLLIEAVKEQQVQINKLQEKIDLLERK